MKTIYKSALCVGALFALLCLLNAHRSFVHSPDGRKTLTVFRPVSWFWRSDYYLIPGRYTDFFPPETNYALIEPVGFCWLEVNWAPLDGHALKMAFTSGCVRDRLSSRVYMSPTGAFDNYRDDEPYQPPKHM
ncbi:hypothetical protein [Hymenobacter arizonensis]|uniref:Uncharacterized protein n=1 Tax=Hymenobacter arizonensis TaxID=1227077 RepID=A0A1I6BKG7_HYMAR|nr:hypothetical protein [Hymenobacter arizonensis]SFQ81297.1 hypothetical protein SAMN04515668_4644 [Hymenobacter arizonensis]